MADWQDKGTLRAAGKTLEYACFGPAPQEAPTIVLLHEGLGCVSLWRDFPQRLSDATGWGVFAYSRAGYGQSDPAELPRPLDYMTQEAENSLPKVLDAIGFQRGVLLGHSDGATIAAIYGGSVSDHRVRGLILMAPHFFTEEGGLQEIARARTAYETTDLRDCLARHHADPDCAFRGWNDAWLNPEFRKWNVADVIDYLRVPVLAIQGKEDAYGTLAQIDVLEQTSYAPVERVILTQCGHEPFREQPVRTLSAITDFIQRLAAFEAAQPDQ